MSNPKSLWGELPLAAAVRTPIVILREQANQLTELTNGLLEGEAVTAKGNGPRPFSIRFNIVAPALDGYIYSVLRAYHDIMLYPVNVDDFVNNFTYTCNDEDEFMAVIAGVLSSSAMHKVVAALISQSKSEETA